MRISLKCSSVSRFLRGVRICPQCAEESVYWYTRWEADILLLDHLLDKAMTMMIDILCTAGLPVVQ